MREALELGATTKDIQHDYRRGFIKFPSHESDLPCHIYSALEVAADYGIYHILDGVARLVSPTAHADYLLARAFVSPTLERADMCLMVLSNLLLTQVSSLECLRQ